MAPRQRLSPLARAVALVVTAAGVASAAAPAHAGMFDGDALNAVNDLRSAHNQRLERLEAGNRGQIELANQIEALRQEVAKLRGQVEVLTFELEAAQKRQTDFYVDLDNRLRKLEPQAPADRAAGEPPKPGEPQAARAYDEALALVKAGKYREAQKALNAFMGKYGDSQLAPAAQFWLANTHFAEKDYTGAIELHTTVLERWPDSSKAPESLQAIAMCQQEMGDKASARKTLEALVARYPSSPAAQAAKKQLAKKG